jgi:NADH-quinone oxidoreductase subunit J
LGSDQLLFYGFGGLTVLGCLLVVVQKNPVYSIVSLILAFFGLAGLYVLLEAPFVAVVQIIVYAGAILVLFLFVVMLLNVPREDAAEWDRTHPLYRPGPMRVGAILALLLIGELGWALYRTPGLMGPIGEQTTGVTDIGELGRVLFTDYMFAFEVTSILIIAAMLGAVILARRPGAGEL